MESLLGAHCTAKIKPCSQRDWFWTAFGEIICGDNLKLTGFFRHRKIYHWTSKWLFLFLAWNFDGKCSILTPIIKILTMPFTDIGSQVSPPISPMHLLHWYLSELIYQNLFLIWYQLQFDKKIIQQWIIHYRNRFW